MRGNIDAHLSVSNTHQVFSQLMVFYIVKTNFQLWFCTQASASRMSLIRGLSPWCILFTVYQMSTHTCAHGNPETTEPRVITNSNLNTICVYMCTYVQAFTQMKANKIHTDALCSQVSSS